MNGLLESDLESYGNGCRLYVYICSIQYTVSLIKKLRRQRERSQSAGDRHSSVLTWVCVAWMYSVVCRAARRCYAVAGWTAAICRPWRSTGAFWVRQSLGLLFDRVAVVCTSCVDALYGHTHTYTICIFFRTPDAFVNGLLKDQMPEVGRTRVIRRRSRRLPQ